MMSREFSSLEKMRRGANLSQADMAAHLEVSQSQVSRYEQDPEDVPMGIYKRWESFCGKVAASQPLCYESDDPYQEVEARRELILNYLGAQPSSPENFPIDQLEKDSGVVSAPNLQETILRVSRKPRVGLFGRFDMGKSRLANMLMGVDRLPADYQPTTSIACLVRHIEDKPLWQPEPVWIMQKGFDLSLPDNEAHCKAHRLYSGGYEALRDHGIHSSKRDRQAVNNAAAAVVYIDSPFLKGCDLIDLPGYQHEKGDDERAEMAQRLVDVIIYVSNATGFMNEQDRSYLAQLTRHLPAFETPENKLAPLCNLYVVATRADTASKSNPQAVLSILEKASTYCFDISGDTLQDRAENTGVSLSREQFYDRFFTYSAEEQDYRERLNGDLSKLLGDIAPKRVLSDMGDAVKKARNANTRSCDALIDSIQSSIENREKAQEEISAVLANERSRIQKRNQHEQKILELIDSLKNDSLKQAKEIYQDRINPKSIEKTIRDRYSDKKEAKELAPAYVIEQLKRSIDSNLQPKAESLSKEVEAFLSNYQSTIDENSYLDSSWNFNARGAFMGALAGIGTFGALASWASAVAAGSNLGGYILAAKIVSMLSSLGISIGGTATVMSIISALGGPFTIGIGIAVSMGLLVFSLFGDSWQLKLSKKISSELEKNDALENIEKQITNYWDDTARAFKHAAEMTEVDFQTKLESLRRIAFETNVEVLKVHLKYAKELRDFFAGLPWRPLQL